MGPEELEAMAAMKRKRRQEREMNFGAQSTTKVGVVLLERVLARNILRTEDEDCAKVKMI